MKKSMLKTMLVLLLPVAMWAQKPNQITVSGTALKCINPTQIIISTGMELQSNTAENAYKNMRNKMAAAVEYLKNQKRVKTFETDRISMYKSHNPNMPPEFRVQQSISITITDMEFYDELMLKLFELGFNNINNVEFAVENMAELKQQVQLEAIRAAKEKAALFAQELDVELGPVLRFEEQNTRSGGGTLANYKTADAVAGPGPSIAPNQVDIMMTVVVSFAIKPVKE